MPETSRVPVVRYKAGKQACAYANWNWPASGFRFPAHWTAQPQSLVAGRRRDLLGNKMGLPRDNGERIYRYSTPWLE